MLPAIIGTVVSLFIAIYALRRRQSPGAGLFSIIMFAISLWSFGNTIETGLSGFSAMFFWARFQYFGILAIPALCLSFSLRYTGRAQWIKPWTRGLLPTFMTYNRKKYIFR